MYNALDEFFNTNLKIEGSNFNNEVSIINRFQTLRTSRRSKRTFGSKNAKQKEAMIIYETSITNWFQILRTFRRSKQTFGSKSWIKKAKDNF